MDIIECILWDKKTDIKGYDCNYWLENYPYFKNTDIMIEKTSGIVTEVRTVDSIRVQLKLSSDLTSQEVVDIYCYNANNNLGQDPEQVRKWKESEVELSQAKFILMKEGLL